MAIPSWYQVQIPTTIPAPTKIVKDIHHISVSTIVGSTIHTNTLNLNTLSTSTIQTNVLNLNSLVGSSIQTNIFNANTISTSTLQANTLSFTTVFGSTIQSNVFQYSTIIGCTIQTNTQDVQLITGSSIQTNALNVSSMISNSIRTNIVATSSLLNDTIITPILYTGSFVGSTIQMKRLTASTVASDSAQLNNLFVSILIGSTLIGNVFQVNALNVSSVTGNMLQTNALQVSTLVGSTIQTDSFIISTINVTNTNTIQMNRLNVGNINSSTITCSTIQTNQMGYYGKIVQIAGEYITFDLGTGGNYHNQYRQVWNVFASVLNIIQFVGSDDGITWTNLGISTPIIFENMHIFSYTLTNVRYIRLIFIGIMSGPTLEYSQKVHLGLFTITYNGGTNLINYILVSGISSVYPTVTEIERWAYFNSFQFNIHSTYSVSIYPAIGYYTGSIYTDVFDINAIAGISLLTTNTIQTNSLYYSTLIGSTIQTNTLQVNTLLGSTFINSSIQTNSLVTSSLIGGTIQTSQLNVSTLSVSTIQTNQINTSTILGGTILMNRLDTSTIICSSIQTNQLNTSTITYNTIQMNTLTANMNIRSSNIIKILGEYLTFDLGTEGNYHNKYSQEMGGGRNYPTKIQFSGSTDGILWVDLGLSEGTIINGSRDDSQPPYWDRIVFNYTTNNYRYLRIILINIWFYYGTYQVSFTDCNISNNDGINIFPTTKTNIIYSQNISTAPGDTLNRAYEFRIKLTTDAYYPWMYHTTGLYIGSVSTNVIDNTTYNNNTIANTIIGSTIQSDTINGGSVQVSTMIGSTIIGNTIQIQQLNISTILGSTIIGSNFQSNRILITDGNKTLSTSAVPVSQLSYISGLTSQAGGTGQNNIWTAANTFTTSPVFTGLTSGTPLYTMGLNNSNQLLRYTQGTQSISGTLTTNYIPYALAVSTLTNSIIYRVNNTDIAIGQTTSTFPTGTGTTVSIAGLLQTTRVAAGTGFFSKIVMTDKRNGLNGTVILGNQGCNFYMGTMNNGTGNLSDVLYLNSGSDTTGNVNAVMFDKSTIGMRIFQGEVGATSPFTTYKDAVMTDANSVNITVGQNSDTDGITFGPNLSTSYLKMGAGTNRASTNVAQIITTNGDLYADCATNTKGLYLNYYVKDVATAYINSYTPWTHTGNFTTTGNIDVRWGITTSDSYINLANKGIYWNSYSRGIGVFNQYEGSNGIIGIHGSGKNNWSGWGIGSKVCLMSNGDTLLFHDNIYGWIIWCEQVYDPRITLGGGSVECSSMFWGGEHFLVFINGYNGVNGVFYVDSSGNYGISSDERIKKNIKPIDADQSIAFIRGIIPSYFCLKNEPVQLDANGKEIEQIHCVDECEQSGFIAQNVLESARKAGLPKSTVSNVYDYEQELSLPEKERKTLLGLSEIPMLSHSYNALKGTMAKQNNQQTQIDEIDAKCSMLDAGLTALQEIVRQNAELLQLLTKT